MPTSFLSLVFDFLNSPIEAEVTYSSEVATPVRSHNFSPENLVQLSLSVLKNVSWCPFDSVMFPSPMRLICYPRLMSRQHGIVFLSEISIAIPSRSEDLEEFVSPIKVYAVFPGEAWRRTIYPYICIDLLLGCDHFQIIFFPSEVKP